MIKKILYEDAIELWGEELQIGMLHEEIGELLKALNKYRRNGCTREYAVYVCDEVADVRIMLEQLLVIMGVSEDSVQAIQHDKLLRLERRIEEAQR